MKKRAIITTLLFLFLIVSTYGQKGFTRGWTIDYSIGYGSYQLEDIKNLLDAMPNHYGLKATDWFPDYVTHSVSLGYTTGQHHFGTGFSYLTTGGRLHRADYSGSMTVDMIMNGYRVGAFYRYYIDTGLPPFSFYLQMSPGALFSNLNMKEKLTIYAESQKNITELKGVGLYLEPTIGMKYRIDNWLHFSLGGGYEFDFLGKMKLSGQKTDIDSKWDGFRLYAGVILFYR